MENVTPGGHASEEELIAHYYGAEEPGADASAHLSECSECRAAFEALKRDMQVASELVVPERGAGYEEHVWARLVAAEPKLAGRGSRAVSGWRAWFAPRHLALAGSLAALVAVAFLAGRYSNSVTGTEQAANAGTAKAEKGSGKAGRERILAVALDTHLADSERILLDVVNSDEGGLGWDSQRDKAESLIDANRLYRLTAARQGQVALAAVLEDLERVLLELAHEPDKNTAAQMTPLRERITDQELVFKLRILQLRLRDQPRRSQGDRKG